MIEADREINDHVIRLQTDINEIQQKIKRRKIIIPISYILIFIYFCSFIKNLSKIFDADLLGFLVIILFWITFYFFHIYDVALQKELCDFENDILDKEKELEETKKFSSYLLACRQIEAKEHGQDIYPEVRYNDSLYVKEEFKDKFEEKRIEYEQRHLGILKLNPYYLDEKLAKAPISTYPIHEQELLYEYQNNKTAFLEERKRILSGKN